MKKLFIIFSIGIAVFISSCTKHLEMENLYKKNLNTYYSTPTEITEAMNGVFNALFVDNVHSNEHLAANLLSDLMLGGGGPDDVSAKNVDNFQDPAEDTYKDLFVQTYNGVFRANAIIEAVSAEDLDFSKYFSTPAEADGFKNATLAEAYFMRGFLMFRAARFFGGLPIYLGTAEHAEVKPRATVTETWGAIVADFIKAAEYFPNKSASSYTIDEYGHANLWVAKAYMARAFLFYTGYMTNIEKQATNSVPLPEGGELTSTTVIAHLEDIMSQSGYSLAPDFRNLWPYSYANINAAIEDPGGAAPLPWAESEGLSWVGQDGPHSTIGTGNYEVMFAMRYALADWSFGQKYNNRVPLFFGIRDHSMVPFGQGWGWGTVHSDFYNQWDNADQRKQGSVLDLANDVDMGTDAWDWGKGDHNTGLVNKKYTTIQHNGPDGTKGLFYYIYDMVHGDPFQLWAAQDFYYLRYADVLLMHSELTETATGLNAVRERAYGYPTDYMPVAYSLSALKNERKFEFAFEGVRWFDLVRWGDVENSANNYFDNSISVNNSGVEGTYSTTYRPETKGLVPFPESEVRLSGGLFEPNPGW